jgi:hypothetical protein
MKQGVGIDLDNDGKPDLNFDLKTIILVVGGIISLTMSYSTLIKKIEFNSEQIEIAKKLPPTQSLEIMENLDMKIYLFNSIALGISMTQIELSLKIILLICTIIYTIKKITEKNNDKN